LEVVLHPSHRIPRVPCYSGSRRIFRNFAYGTFTPCGTAFHPSSARFIQCLCRSEPPDNCKPGVGLIRFRTPRLTESLLFSFREGTKMFQFPSYRLNTLWIHVLIPMFLPSVGFPIRTSVVHRLFAPTHSFSQLVTSFFASQCQGIHPALLVA
jgi:hypothetical protein